MPGPLSDADRERCRHHLGYMSTSVGTSLAAGFPMATPLLFTLENAMQNIMPVAVGRLLQLLDGLDGIEQQLDDAQPLLAVSETDGVTLRGAQPGRTHPDLLEREFVRKANRLASLLGVRPNPLDSRFQSVGGDGMVSSVRVREF